MLLCIVVISSSSPPLPLISYEPICSSFVSESLLGDPKVVLDLFFSGEVIGSGLNLSIIP
jgi:hypothetical protein